jgi:DNA processing protein
MNISELPYYITLSHFLKWRNEKINNLIYKIIIENKSTLEDFFSSSEIDFQEIYNMDLSDASALNSIKSEIPNNSFLAEDLISQGFEVLTIDSSDYPPIMKENLGLKYSPPIIYIKGNKQIFEENSIAVVGSRNASEISLDFTDNIVNLFSKQFKVIVSGFAKGVDQQALESALKHLGRSIIVLPQGIMTFGSGINKYYKQITEGDVVVLSTFYPKAPWSVQFAMTRNPIIYALAKDIYVAESNEKGGTWSGATDGIRKGRKIYVREPGGDEINANNLLIKKGAIPVDFNGSPLYENEDVKITISLVGRKSEEEINKEKILKILEVKELTIKEILERTGIKWSVAKLKKYLSKIEGIEITGKRPKKYRIKNSKEETQEKLF